ncbi:hypothetical protein [Vulcanisaeta distributa]|uniref:hypothetical protein n=1 Tax=Vulcanisaeta distributa TaxID=164451 RepID=UPI000A5C9846|nr:hypothetical protein [Vulcanisaeta distributa]
MSTNIDPAQIITRVLSKVYEYLREDFRVIRPGSVRSFEAAASDIMMRILIEGGFDYDKFKETVIRVGIENLYLSVETSNPDDKRKVLEEAFERAFEDAEKMQETTEEAPTQQVAGFNVSNGGEINENVERSDYESSTGSISGGFGAEYSARRVRSYRWVGHWLPMLMIMARTQSSTQ